MLEGSLHACVGVLRQTLLLFQERTYNLLVRTRRDKLLKAMYSDCSQVMSWENSWCLLCDGHAYGTTAHIYCIEAARAIPRAAPAMASPPGLLHKPWYKWPLACFPILQRLFLDMPDNIVCLVLSNMRLDNQKLELAFTLVS